MNIFDIWNKRKKNIHDQLDVPEFYERQIWWVSFGKNIASEIMGKGDDFVRPAIVLRKFFLDACLIIPVTSKKKKGTFYYAFKNNNGLSRWAVLYQIRYIDARRLKKFQCNMRRSCFRELRLRCAEIILKKITPSDELREP